MTSEIKMYDSPKALFQFWKDDKYHNAEQLMSTKEVEAYKKLHNFDSYRPVGNARQPLNTVIQANSYETPNIKPIIGALLVGFLVGILLTRLTYGV